jgi:hypothetical protein
MTHPHLLRLAAVTALAAIGPLSQAAPVADAAGDFLASYVTSLRPLGADLDVVSADVIYHPALHQFTFVATMAGAIGTTAAANGETPLYVWGIDRGEGTERFLGGSPSIGDGVAFDAVLLLNPNGNATVNLFGLGGAATILAGIAQVDGDTISATLDESLFPSRGLAFDRYTWNMWPRFGASNNAQISDFAPNEAAGAPDAANAPVSIPEPSTLAIAALGLAALAGRRRRNAA